jgi:FAD:protein FMN transferase
MNCNILKIKLVGGEVEFRLYDVSEEAINLIKDDLIKEAKRLEKIFNFFDDKSELSLLNKKRNLKVSDELREVLEKALNYAEQTKGEYDISLGRRILERKTGKDKINGMRNDKINYSYKDIMLEKNMIKLIKNDLLIDLGSIAKGYIADRLADFLKKSGVKSGLIDARGDILIFGNAKETVLVQHPRDEKKTIEKICLHNNAVATSGDYKQFYGNYDNSHILNQKDLISVTVLAKNLADADVLASAVFVSKENERRKIIETAVKFGASILTVNNNLKISKYNWKDK